MNDVTEMLTMDPDNAPSTARNPTSRIGVEMIAKITNVASTSSPGLIASKALPTRDEIPPTIARTRITRAATNPSTMTASMTQKGKVSTNKNGRQSATPIDPNTQATVSVSS